ncbi:MAG TPA: UrcA family protein [Steroidobacteraceae bacterium]|nr:UrcA family protein [Steroidobacteraceae bacterium]
MSKSMLVIAAGAVAATIVAGNVLAQDMAMPEVVVETHREVSTTIGKSASGVPIVEVSEGYTVSAKGLDISTPIGARAFEARVADAARALCEELGRRYPGSTPSNAECAKQATDKAMAKVRQLEDAASKKK